MVLEVWNKQESDTLLGLIHLNLKAIYSFWETSKSSLEINKFPLIVCDDNFNIKGLGGAFPKGIVKVSVAFGTLTQVIFYTNLKSLFHN